MPVSYEYSIGSVRAREKRLLSSSDIEAMLACKSVKELEAYLSDKGYAQGESVDEILANSRNETVKYLFDIVPDSSVFNVFLYPNDAHNIKAVIKGLLAGVDYKRLFLKPCLIETEIIETAVKERKYGILPEDFAAAAEKAYEILARTADARKADSYIDRQCMLLQLEAAKKTKIDFLIEYINTEVFYRNIKIALRGAATNAPVDYYETALCAVDGLDTKTLVSYAIKGSGALVEYLSSKSEYKLNEAMERYKDSPAEFERFGDNLLMRLALESCKRSGIGANAALGYYIAKAAEDKAVHIIAAGIETDAKPELTRERLRDIYG